MNKRTLKGKKEFINGLLTQYDQNILIEEINRTIILFSNGVMLNGDEKRKYQRLFTQLNNPLYAKSSDKILTSEDKLGMIESLIKQSIKESQKKGGKRVHEIHKHIISNNLTDRVPWNKGMVGVQVAWNKGLTKYTSPSVMSTSIKMSGENNPQYGKPIPEHQRIQQSETIKIKIKSGDFTPNIHNSRTHWTSEWNGQKYRSSWEMVFHQLNPELEYEKTRIPYMYENKERIYITDFTDSKNKIIYEIKPSSQKNNSKVVAKEKAAIIWCSKNGYEYRIITEKDEPRLCE